MTRHYIVEKSSEEGGIVELKVGFGMPAQNPILVADAVEAVKALCLKGGELVKINGPCSMPVAMSIAHEVCHLFAAVACFDPKISPGYVICISHDPKYTVGQQVG